MQTHNLSFYQLGLAPKMLNILTALRFISPTPIQQKAIPIALENKDVVGIAQTGTGKTLAFGIPMAQRMTAIKGKGLVLVPTRELAYQVEEALQQVLMPFGIQSVVLVGGVPIHKQIQKLKRHPRVIIATPGRLIDHMEQRKVSVRDVSILVLDEADRMFDLGFAPQVKRILREVPRDRQTMLFSATMPSDIVRLATHHMKLPVNVEIAPSGTMAEQVTQELFIVNPRTKRVLLGKLLDQYRGSILLFTRTKIGARKVSRFIRDCGHNAVEIHSDRTMPQRKQAIEGFKTGRHRVLVATDIAARGIDVSGIEVVINYDLPEDIENYVHRIGRTGRMGHEGHAISFATPDQGQDVERIERLIRKTLPIVSHPDIPVDEFIKQIKKTSREVWRSLSRGGRRRSRSRKR